MVFESKKIENQDGFLKKKFLQIHGMTNSCFKGYAVKKINENLK